MPQQRQHKGVHVPRGRLQPVDEKQPAEHRLGQQVQRTRPGAPGGSSDRRQLLDAARQRPAGQWQQRHQHKGGAIADQISSHQTSVIDQHAGGKRADKVGGGWRNRQPAENLLELRRAAGRSPDMTLQRDDGDASGAPSQQCGQAKHRQHRPDGGQRGAADSRHDGDQQRCSQSVPVGKTPGRQRQKHLCQRKQRQQNAHRRSAVALLQGQQRRGQPHAGHGGMQADLCGDKAKQFRRHSVTDSVSLEPVTTVGVTAADRHRRQGRRRCLRSAAAPVPALRAALRRS